MVIYLEIFNVFISFHLACWLDVFMLYRQMQQTKIPNNCVIVSLAHTCVISVISRRQPNQTEGNLTPRLAIQGIHGFALEVPLMPWGGTPAAVSAITRVCRSPPPSRYTRRAFVMGTYCFDMGRIHRGPNYVVGIHRAELTTVRKCLLPNGSMLM